MATKSVDNYTSVDFKSPVCPYPISPAPKHEKQTLIRIDYDLEYDEKHEVIKVEVGKTDIVKEVNSHKNEVGLVNVIKMAIAHGENPYEKFKKSEPGVMFCVDPNSTQDEIVEAYKQTNGRIDELAKELGVSTAELVHALNDGTINKLVEDAIKSKNKTDSNNEGGDK